MGDARDTAISRELHDNTESWVPLPPGLALGPSAERPDPAATCTMSYEWLLTDQPQVSWFRKGSSGWTDRILSGILPPCDQPTGKLWLKQEEPATAVAEGRAAALAVTGEPNSYRPRCLGLAHRGQPSTGWLRAQAGGQRKPALLTGCWWQHGPTANSGGAGGPFG